jgi:hypothetical protein
VFQLKTPLGGVAKKQKVDIIGNHGLQKSPSEVLEPAQFRQFLVDLREHYDYIFLESASLNEYSDAQELVSFAGIPAKHRRQVCRRCTDGSRFEEPELGATGLIFSK